MVVHGEVRGVVRGVRGAGVHGWACDGEAVSYFKDIRPLLRKALQHARAGNCASAMSAARSAGHVYDTLGFREAKLEAAVKRVRRVVARCTKGRG